METVLSLQAANSLTLIAALIAVCIDGCSTGKKKRKGNVKPGGRVRYGISVQDSMIP